MPRKRYNQPDRKLGLSVGINEECPRYVALVADRYVESDDDLDVLIALVRADGLGTGEDCAIWDGWRTVAAVVRSDGSVHRFEPLATKKGNGLARRHAARSGRGRCPAIPSAKNNREVGA